jgi:hypothetical protein
LIPNGREVRPERQKTKHRKNQKCMTTIEDVMSKVVFDVQSKKADPLFM